MTEQVDLLNQMIEHNLWNVLLPTFLKIVIAAITPAVIGLVMLAILKNTPLPNVFKILIGIVVRIIAIIAIIISTTTAIKNIEMPEIPSFTLGEENMLSEPEYKEDVRNPYF